MYGINLNISLFDDDNIIDLATLFAGRKINKWEATTTKLTLILR